jgi:hypothetical protein
MVKVAVVADLVEAVTPDSIGDDAACTFEFVSALAELAQGRNGLSIELVARRGSWRKLPLTSIDPSELPETANFPDDSAVRAETALTQFVLTGRLSGCDVVHSFAPAITPLQCLAALGVRVLHTYFVREGHPGAHWPRFLIRSQLLCSLPIAGGAPDLATGALPIPVDMQRFGLPSALPRHARYLLWPGKGNQTEQAWARRVADIIGLPLQGLGEGDPVEQLSHASAWLDLTEVTNSSHAVWPLRAMACGVPGSAKVCRFG